MMAKDRPERWTAPNPSAHEQLFASAKSTPPETLEVTGHPVTDLTVSLILTGQDKGLDLNEILVLVVTRLADDRGEDGALIILHLICELFRLDKDPEFFDGLFS